MKIEIGAYFPDKGMDGKSCWTVCTGKGEYFDCKRQDDAEILSRLVKIERLLRKRKR